MKTCRIDKTLILGPFFPLQIIAEYLKKIDPKSDGSKRDWVAIYDECASVLYQVMIFWNLVALLG